MYSQYRQQIYKSGPKRGGLRKRKVLNRGVRKLKTSLWTPGGKEILSNRGFVSSQGSCEKDQICKYNMLVNIMLKYIYMQIIYAWP